MSKIKCMLSNFAVSWGFILKPNDPDLRRAIGLDDHLDQSHAQDLGQRLNPVTAGAAYIRIFIFSLRIKYHLFNMLEIKCDINQ